MQGRAAVIDRLVQIRLLSLETDGTVLTLHPVYAEALEFLL